ncbi:MAG: 50S ribosomal protein L21 [bacterium]
MEKQNKYAVIRLQGHQYRVAEGDEILVDKISDIKKINPEVLLFVDGATVKVGKPTLSDVKVKVKVLTEIEKGKKIDVLKYKAKSRYRKHIGFRPKFTRLLIEKIS